MPGDISKHTKCIVDLPYPEPRVECKNVSYANILLQDYAGEVSEQTAISLYTYQHIISKGPYKEYSKIIGGVSISEMKHFELLAETIKLLGVKPVLIDSVYNSGKLWNASYVNFDTCIKQMILEDIRSETKAIENYQMHLYLINDKYIRKLLERIILDEKLHLKIFQDLYKKYSRCGTV